MATKTKKATAKKSVKKETNFAQGVFIREVTFEDGNTITNVNFNAKAFCNWMQDNVDAMGYVRTTLISNKEGSKFTHSMIHNNYNPQQAAKQAIKETADNLPF